VIVRAATARVRGSATLRFERRGVRTVLASSRVEAPMAIVRPFPLPDGGVLIQLLSLGPGLCGGDILTLDITAGAGCRVAVTTTAATRLMAMEPDRHAEQHVHLRAGDDATLEYHPCLTIPFPASALVQTIAAEITGASRLGILECWSMGRVARDEYLQFRSLASRTTIGVAGAVCYADAIHLEPARTELAGCGVLAGHRYLAAGAWCGVTLTGKTVPAGGDDTLVAFDQSAPGLAYLRVLGPDATRVDAVLAASVERVARSWGLQPIVLDRFHC
jgi:urease accessory protein